MNDCWNRIGIRGDGSCPDLKQYVHCRNCPVHAASAVELLQSDAPHGYVAEWTDHLSRAKPDPGRVSDAVVIFRLGSEWLGLPAGVIEEVAHPRAVHSIPHRRAGVLGLTNVRGELLVCVSLSAVLGLIGEDRPAGHAHTASPRLMVIRRDDVRAACPVDHVDGVHQFHPRDLREVPSTVRRSTIRHSTNLLPWQGRSVGVLDERLLFDSLRRSFA